MGDAILVADAQDYQYRRDSFVLAHKEIENEQQVVKWIESVSGTEKIELVR